MLMFFFGGFHPVFSIFWMFWMRFPAGCADRRSLRLEGLRSSYVPWLKDAFKTFMATVPLTQMERQQLFHCFFFKMISHISQYVLNVSSWKGLGKLERNAQGQIKIRQGARLFGARLWQEGSWFQNRWFDPAEGLECINIRGPLVPAWVANWTRFSGIGKLNVILKKG